VDAAQDDSCMKCWTRQADRVETVVFGIRAVDGSTKVLFDAHREAVQTCRYCRLRYRVRNAAMLSGIVTGVLLLLMSLGPIRPVVTKLDHLGNLVILFLNENRPRVLLVGVILFLIGYWRCDPDSELASGLRAGYCAYREKDLSVAGIEVRWREVADGPGSSSTQGGA
jgi:hypothetical protein